LSGLTDAWLRLLIQAAQPCLLTSAPPCAIPLLSDRQFAEAAQLHVAFSEISSGLFVALIKVAV